MKPALCIALFLSISLSCISQIERESINFLEGLIRKSQPVGQIVYTNKINSNVLLKLKSELKKSKITGTTKETMDNYIVLTREEKNFLLDQLEIFAKPYWNDNLFSDSKVIEEEKSEAYIRRAHQEYTENYSDPNSTPIDKSNLIKNYHIPNVFEFTMPIFIRDDSYCLVFMLSRCGSPCGFDELSFYKRVNNTWSKFIVVNSDIF